MIVNQVIVIEIQRGMAVGRPDDLPVKSAAKLLADSIAQVIC